MKPLLFGVGIVALVFGMNWQRGSVTASDPYADPYKVEVVAELKPSESAGSQAVSQAGEILTPRVERLETSVFQLQQKAEELEKKIASYHTPVVSQSLPPVPDPKADAETSQPAEAAKAAEVVDSLDGSHLKTVETVQYYEPRVQTQRVRQVVRMSPVVRTSSPAVVTTQQFYQSRRQPVFGGLFNGQFSRTRAVCTGPGCL